MQKFIIAVICVLGIVTAYAENDNAATSKEYVDTELATKQPTVPAEGNNVVMTFDSTATDGIGTKQIYDESASYAEQQNALVTAATANAAVQMAIQGEFECVLYDPDDPTDCWWWNIKSATQQRLTAGYTELEYIESTGTQYIDTGIVNARYVHDIKFTSTGRELMGQSPQSGSYWGSASGANRYEFGSESIWSNTQQRRIIEYNSLHNITTLSTNNETVSVKPYMLIEWNYHIFHINPAYSNVSYFASARLYDFKAFNSDNNLIQHLIPAKRNSDGVLGMYDTVSGNFFTNAGTGEFIAGPVASFIPQNVQSQ